MAVQPGQAVRFEHAAVQVGGRTIWSDVNLTVDSGEFMAVLGPNGVGKSTLIKAALGLVGLSAGSVTVLGRPAGQSGKEIGYLPQRRNFDAGLRVRGIDIVSLGADGERWGVPVPWGDRLFPARRAAKGPGARGHRVGRRAPHSPAGRSARCPAASSSGC